MILRRDTTIEVDTKPERAEIKIRYPLIKDLAVYWSAAKRKWFVSCRCSELEAKGIEEMYSTKSPLV
jgi:hypothetical protein